MYLPETWDLWRDKSFQVNKHDSSEINKQVGPAGGKKSVCTEPLGACEVLQWMIFSELITSDSSHGCGRYTGRHQLLVPALPAASQALQHPLQPGRAHPGRVVSADIPRPEHWYRVSGNKKFPRSVTTNVEVKTLDMFLNLSKCGALCC